MADLDPELVRTLDLIEHRVARRRLAHGGLHVFGGVLLAAVGLDHASPLGLVEAVTTILAASMLAGLAVSHGMRSIEQVKRTGLRVRA